MSEPESVWVVAAPTRPWLCLGVGGLRNWLWYYELVPQLVPDQEVFRWGLTNSTDRTAPRLKDFS